MTVETAARFIGDLNESYPRSRDLINEGDDHIRLLKAVLKNTMPGFTTSTTMTSDKLNKLDKSLAYSADGVITIGNSLTMAADKVLNAGGNIINNVAAPKEPMDAVNLQYLQTLGAWPIGSIFMTVDARNPREIFGFGTWEEFAKGRVIIGTGQNTDDGLVSKTFKNEEKGGHYESEITTEQLPPHVHMVKGETSETGNHNHGFIAGGGSDGPRREAIAIDETLDLNNHNYQGERLEDKTPAVNTNGAHTHEIEFNSEETGGGEAFSLIQPWVAVNIWKRVADAKE